MSSCECTRSIYLRMSVLCRKPNSRASRSKLHRMLKAFLWDSYQFDLILSIFFQDFSRKARSKRRLGAFDRCPNSKFPFLFLIFLQFQAEYICCSRTVNRVRSRLDVGVSECVCPNSILGSGVALGGLKAVLKQKSLWVSWAWVRLTFNIIMPNNSLKDSSMRHNAPNDKLYKQ